MTSIPRSPIANSIILDSTCHSDIHKYYDFGRVVGHGHFGTVREVTRKSDSSFVAAVKTIPKEKIMGEVNILRRELEMLQMLDHPNTIKFYETYEDDRAFHLVMEFCRGGDLFDFVISQGQCSEAMAASLMAKMFSAVHYMHSIHVCHRDLKPENFLFETKDPRSEIKIIDFGLANKFGDDESNMHTIVGSPYYVAPEVLRGNYHHECDIWSMGVILYVLIGGFPPFQGDNATEVFQSIARCNYSMDFEEFKEASQDVKDLIQRLLVLEPEKRLSIPDILQHNWFTLHNTQSSKQLPLRVLSSLKKFKAPSKLQQESMKILIRLLRTEEIEELRVRFTQSAFQAIDVDHTGFITIAGLETALHSRGWRLAEEELKSERYVEMRGMFDYLDQGRLNYTQFLMATLDKSRLLNEDRVYAAFCHFDIQGTGKITPFSLAEALIRAGLEVSKEEVEEMIEEVNVNRSRQIDFDEFKSMLQNAVQSASPVKLLRKRTGNSETRADDHVPH